MLVPVSLAFPTALRNKKNRSKNVTVAGWRGTNEKLSHTERCADTADHSKNKQNSRSSSSHHIWTPTLTLTRRGGRRRFLWVLWDGTYKLLVVILVEGHVSSFPCNPEDLSDATSEAAEAHPELELPWTPLFSSTFDTAVCWVARSCNCQRAHSSCFESLVSCWCLEQRIHYSVKTTKPLTGEAKNRLPHQSLDSNVADHINNTLHPITSPLGRFSKNCAGSKYTPSYI